MHADGSFVITKHPGTGGIVSVGTVTAQLMYEVREPKYLTPDVATRFDTIQIGQEGPDRVSVGGVLGEPPPFTTKVCINNLAGHGNTMTLLLAGLDIDKKAKIVEETLFKALGGKEALETVEVEGAGHVVRAYPALIDEGTTVAVAMMQAGIRRIALSLDAPHPEIHDEFRKVQGSAVGLLKDAIAESDITAFEPARLPLSQVIQPAEGAERGPRVAVLLNNVETGESVLRTAVRLAGGDLSCVAVLILPGRGAEASELRRLFRSVLPGEPGHVRLVAGGDLNDLAMTMRELFASMLVVPATAEMTTDDSLRFLREQLRCPVCVVREWGE